MKVGVGMHNNIRLGNVHRQQDADLYDSGISDGRKPDQALIEAWAVRRHDLSILQAR